MTMGRQFPPWGRRRKTDSGDDKKKPPQQSSTYSNSSGGVIQLEDSDGNGNIRSTAATAATSGAISIATTNGSKSTSTPAVPAANSSAPSTSSTQRGRAAASLGEFLVTIPPGTTPGEDFQVMAGGEIRRVRCPLKSIPGQQVKISLPMLVQQQRRTGNEINGGSGDDNSSGKQLPRSSSAEALSSSQSSDNLINQQQQENNQNNDRNEMKLFEVIVPKGVMPGSPFSLLAGGVRVLVTCPNNASPGNKIRFHLPIELLNKPDGPKSHLAEIVLSYDKNGWTRTIRATTDMKFIWARLDENSNVDQCTRFDTERSAYVRNIIYKREKGGKFDETMIRGYCTLVTPDRVAVNSCVKNAEGDEIVTFRDIVAAQMMTYGDKVEWFHATCKQLTPQGGIRLCINRASLLEDSINRVMSLHPTSLRKLWMIDFIGEPGLDAGGLMKEWFELVAEELFNPDRGLWKETSNNQLQINPLSDHLCEHHLTYFRFAGRFMGRAIFSRQLVKGHMQKHVYKHILGFPIMFNDLKDLDEDFFNSMKNLERTSHQYSASEFEALTLDFTMIEDALPWEAEANVVELVPGGTQINVSQENLPEYIEAYLKYLVMRRYEAQLNEILMGIYEVVPEALFTIFDFHELELYMCGLPVIDMNDWMANTVYEGEYKNIGSSHVVCMWFWDIVCEYDHELKARLLQFVTGTSLVPSKGFGFLRDHRGIKKFEIQSVPYGLYKFPRSHTCFNRLDLPIYATREELEKNLKIAITMAATGFDIE